MYPIITVFGINISLAKFFLGLSVVISIISGAIRSQKFDTSKKTGMLIIAIEYLGFVAGSKILFLINNWSSIHGGIEVGGLLVYGGILLWPLYMYCFSNFFKMDRKSFYDFSVVIIPWGLAIYRIGCFCNGCCDGIPADWGFAMAHSPEVLRVPTQLLELVCDLGIFAMLLVAERKNWFNGTKGILYPMFLVSYGVIRFVIESFRVRHILLWGMSQAHFLSLISIAIGIVWIVLAVKKHNKKVSA